MGGGWGFSWRRALITSSSALAASDCVDAVSGRSSVSSSSCRTCSGSAAARSWWSRRGLTEGGEAGVGSWTTSTGASAGSAEAAVEGKEMMLLSRVSSPDFPLKDLSPVLGRV